jgi:hypothetical protein
MDNNETFPQAIKRLDCGIERDRKLGNLCYTLVMGFVFVAIGLAFFLLHLQLHQSHLA